MDFKNEKIHQIALSLVKGLGPRVFRLIMQEFETVEEIFELDEENLRAFISKESMRNAILKKETFERAEKEYEFCEKNGIDILFFKDEKYPQRLNFYENMPCVLYFKGNCDLNAKRIVSIVGTRAPSSIASAQVASIVKELQKHDCVIVSGLAYGIDGMAHNSALKCNLRTIAALAHGLDNVYPSDHKSMADKMRENGGLLSQYISQTEMLPALFPTRNRIVAALSDAVIVVQSARKGGSLITAEFANEYGKDVFAVPGRPGDKSSEGCNLLIKSHKAHMYESVKDLEYITRWSSKKTAVQSRLFEDLSKEESDIVNYIRNKGDVHIDEIHQYVNKPTGSLAAVILNLELKGIIKSIPGKRYLCL